MIRTSLVLFFILWMSSAVLQAQNLQLHYDMGKGRGYLTSTVEMFRPDRYGSTFFFIDMDYGVGDTRGVSLAYWEIARAIRFWEGPWAFHLEYNGGLYRWQEGTDSGAGGFPDAWYAGIQYSRDAADYSKGFTLQALYKTLRGKQNLSFQLTGVWYLNLFNDKISFTGYADFWREDCTFEGEKTRFIFQSEPQLWYNLTKNMALGGEVEVDYNFLVKGWKLCPTVGTKVTF